ncbi:transporter [Ganoderma sinense ZZ0214-1]|uniref:Transporter n=1 Tax=Ganoderma sinense ZZ0214-1 TaxID=1077348 RepID=A0A2G8SFN9_9APHY|nr:transporter [Ganoderma sinense ZZ0214-1]
MSDHGRGDWGSLAVRRTEDTEDGVCDLNVPTLLPREDDASILQIYAGNAFNAVIMPVWDSIKPDRIPTYPGWGESLYNIFIRSWYNIVCILVPLALAWVAKFEVLDWGELVTFVLCFIAMIPLQKTLDWGAEQMGLFLGKELSDLLVITLSNAIEAALAVILLFKCELRLLQSTIVGVVLLHLLLIPGVAFFVQGTQVYEQKLSPQFNLNHSLLMTGLLGILVPTIFFAALDRGSVAAGSGDQSGLTANFVPLVSDSVRWDILRMSRGISIMLILIYVTSCLYRNQVLPAHHAHALPLHEGDVIGQLVIQSPPHSRTPSLSRQPRRTMTSSPILLTRTISQPDTSPRALRSMTSPAAPLTANEHEERRADVNPWVCMILLVVAVGFMGATAEFLVSSIEVVLNTTHLPDEWFGLILLPNISFSADGFVVTVNFLLALVRHLYRKVRKPKSRKSRKARLHPRKLADRQHPSLYDPKCSEPKLSPTEDQDVLHTGFVSDPEAMDPVLPHPHQRARSDEVIGANHTRGASTTTALAHRPPAITVRSPTASSVAPTGSRSATNDTGQCGDGGADIDAEAEDEKKFEHVDADVESARPVDALDEDGDEDEDSDGAGGGWSIFNVVPEMPWASEFAHGRPIDLSIQFTLWWMPFLVLLGWWTDRPMHLLFDYFEIGMLLGACFLVNWVTSDAKTNMSEGLTMITFYAMIATAAWWYPGQPQVAFMLNCPGSVAEAVAAAGNATSV